MNKANNKYGTLFTGLFELVEKKLSEKRFINIAVDGLCGSGKSTLGDLLRKTYDANLISTDVFFLPDELRSKERFQTPGENIHHERFVDEVGPIARNEPFSYRVFDCSVMDYTATVSVMPKRVSIVEGSYSLHPRFSSLYDIRVFLKVSAEQQLSRISTRNGEEALKMFIDRWIPLELEYFKAFEIEENADLVFDTTASEEDFLG